MFGTGQVFFPAGASGCDKMDMSAHLASGLLHSLEWSHNEVLD